MEKTELISRLAERTGTSRAQAKAAVNAFTEIVAEALIKTPVAPRTGAWIEI